MTCVAGCVCSCGQLGCGCHEEANRPVVLNSWPTCSLCGGKVKAYVVVSPGRDRHLIKLCPTCDVRQCGGDDGCGHHEQDPHATKCSNCGRVFPK